MYLIAVHKLVQNNICSSGVIELNLTSFTKKFGITSVLLLAMIGLSACDISPEKHNSQARLSSSSEGYLNQHLAKIRTQSFNERGASS